MSSNAQDESVQWTSGDVSSGTSTPQQQQSLDQVNANDNESNAAATAAASFSHPGARAILEGAASGDGPYRCRKCVVITVTGDDEREEKKEKEKARLEQLVLRTVIFRGVRGAGVAHALLD
ncbi:hypothetical protein EDB83DRAFT_2313688 [Lactarius deliciosus]|nr:hypothetical protein EDB83DRAFT_2313688 [Lactarius deliciosus]